ncbi:MAG TPA: regulatory iron-sulfur-containing complex subunit RicT [Spirochaetota bacterium]|nr:regulatory iron-sulfur-containing complex subunit RicT [Spirochaetota bacterium]HNT09445.1 regulatory iron-sulfur-containing complex subunit RicT [Spirochaetota bacterium]HNV45483.1 regulatory iron-sulfur-containing complex subunit RicT [Spirochaetota bacterium]HOS38725.1 regulatory iron-sulfur-containing complex subunit RicT [Spirochaetota bacterium]HPI22181.1 regulatory iron-sulfur-containing complex subunit RicT [Spirochaetota bacterium]
MDVALIRLRNTSQISCVNTNNLFIKSGTHCVIEMDNGVDLGQVLKRQSSVKTNGAEVKGKLLRKATPDDFKRVPELEALENRAFAVCRDKARERGLGMRLVSVKCLFDKTKIIFYFVAENRIDFRELVRDLASAFKTRIEMRQIGVRDKAKLMGGFGPCGRELCCSCLKEEFEPVSIKMAKEQNLNLNSLKISGMCGRLLCCLWHEYDVYRELNRDLPSVGNEVRTEKKTYTVDSVDTLKQQIRLRSRDCVLCVAKRDLTRAGDHYTVSEELIQQKIKQFEDDENAE